jgi:hypothetical protein
MSSGAFTLAGYSTDNGDIVGIRVQPETLTAVLGTANASAGATFAAGFPSAQISRGKRTIGINARTVSIRLTAALTGYKADSILRIPVTTQARWAGLSRGTIVTYLATAGVVVGKTPEYIN